MAASGLERDAIRRESLPPGLGTTTCLSGPRFSRAPLWINAILLARRFLRLFSGSWSREAKPSPDSAFTQRGCFNARPTHYSRYFYPGTHHFGLRSSSVSLFAMDGGGGRNDLWTVHHLLRNAPGARQPETADRRRLRQRFGDCGCLHHVAGARPGLARALFAALSPAADDLRRPDCGC